VTPSGELWGGRFSTSPDPDLFRLTASIDVDMLLLPYDLAATKAHARMLEKAGVLDGDGVAAIDEACDRILAEVDSGELAPTAGDEDVHSFVERTLTERAGVAGRSIHAGRSRNDLVAADLRMWCRAAAIDLVHLTGALIGTLADVAGRHIDTLMPGYTHLQRAQPVSLGFHLAAHGFALARDGDRFGAAATSASISPLGAGALAGTTLPLDPAVAAAELGLVDVFDNAMDAVSDRDFVCDLAYAAALCGVHLSRLAEEVVLWTSSEFGFATLDDAWSTGSSMMPQKRNPDVAELTRGRAAPGIGELTALLTMLKGLPLAYDRDLQEDKALIFAIVARTRVSLQAMGRLVATLTFDIERLERAARGGATWATDLAELLVARGVPFRDAHERVGALVRSLEAKSESLPDGEALAALDPTLTTEDRASLDARSGLKARSGPGGPAPARVIEQLETLRAAAERFRHA
jgi:argininosuccinate lyase